VKTTPLLICLSIALSSAGVAQVAYGTGTAGSGGIVPALSCDQAWMGNGAFELRIDNALGGATAWVGVSFAQGGGVIGGASLLIDLAPSVLFLAQPLPLSGPVAVPGAGSATLPYPLTLPVTPALAGLTLYAQAGVDEGSGVWSASRGVMVTLTMPPRILVGTSTNGNNDPFYLVDASTPSAPSLVTGYNTSGGPSAPVNNCSGIDLGDGGRRAFVSHSLGGGVLQLNLDTTPPTWTSLANIGTSYGVAWDALYGRAYTLLTPVAGGTELTGIDGTIGSATYGQVVASTSGLFSSGLIERWSLSPDGRTAAVLTVLNRNLILVDTDPASPGYMSWVNTGPAPAGPGVFPVTTRCAFTPDSAQLLVTIQTGAGAPGEIARYDLNSGQWIDHNPGMFGTQNIGLQSAPAVSVPSAPGDVEVANDGTYAIVVGWNGPGGIIRIDLDPVAPQVWSAAVINSPVSLAGDARVCAISPDSEHFVTYGSGDVLVFEAAGFLAGQVSLPGVLSVNTISWE